MQRRRAQVSAIIVCYNEEDNIRACLESVTWCDEIVVVDAHSTDRTLDIVREFTDRDLHPRLAGIPRAKAVRPRSG